MSRPTVISGCSGSGKSTLLDELDRRGYRVHHEPGRLNHYLRHDLPVLLRLAQSREAYPYASRVFMSPPWPEIYETDSERRHGFEDARDEHDRLVVTYSQLGYEMVVIPKLAVRERTDFVVNRLGAPAPRR